jgi:hypothetical protein
MLRSPGSLGTRDDRRWAGPASEESRSRNGRQRRRNVVAAERRKGNAPRWGAWSSKPGTPIPSRPVAYRNRLICHGSARRLSRPVPLDLAPCHRVGWHFGWQSSFLSTHIRKRAAKRYERLYVCSSGLEIGCRWNRSRSVGFFPALTMCIRSAHILLQHDKTRHNATRANQKERFNDRRSARARRRSPASDAND